MAGPRAVLIVYCLVIGVGILLSILLGVTHR